MDNVDAHVIRRALESAQTHKEFLALVRFGLEFLLYENQALLIEAIIADASRSRVNPDTLAVRVNETLEELGLHLEVTNPEEPPPVSTEPASDPGSLKTVDTDPETGDIL